jgi:peptide/nickel transport system permease protein/oligopeptide transport system permease protein
MASPTELATSAAAGPVTDPTAAATEKSESLFSDAWRDLRRNPIFWVSTVLILLVVTMAVFPSLFTSADPRLCQLSRQHEGPSGSALFGYNFQGCDVFARTVYGARASITVGVLGVVIAALLSLVIGMSAGYFGGWIDAVLSRIIDIVLGIPYLLAAIVLARRLTAGRDDPGLVPVVLVLGVLGWTQAARVLRASVISAKQQDYVAAARMLGASNLRIMRKHILPNAITPMVVVLTLAMGGFIAAEATLSFLGVGLRDPAISWGIDIANAQLHVREASLPLIAPAAFLGLTVLAFIMLGDAVRDALDPKLR